MCKLCSCLAVFLLLPLDIGAFPSIGHEFIPSNNPVEERSPCPGLNTLANHGYISRDGRNVSVAQVVQAAEDVFGVSTEFEDQLRNSFEEKGFMPRPVDGGQDEVFDLADLYEENKVDHDASFFRQDPSELDPFPQFDQYLFDGMVAEQRAYDMGQGTANRTATTTTYITWEGIARHAVNRIRYSRKNNLKYNLEDKNGRANQIAADMAFLFVFDVHPTFEMASVANLQSFIGENRIPKDFIPRKELGLPVMVKDDMTQRLRYFLPRVTQAMVDSTVTTAECMMGMSSLRLDMKEFRHYDKWFRSDSKITLPQAGTYYGPEDMEEYMRFATDASPFVLEREDIVRTTPRLKSIDQVNGICTFTSSLTARVVLNPETARDGILLIGIMYKLYYNFHENYVPEVNVMFTDDWYRELFGNLLQTEQTKRFICGISSDSCPDTNIGIGLQECMQKLEELPALTKGSYFDGKDYGCRALHAILAEYNNKHCPHISFEPQLDQNNQTKCQTSKEYEVTDFFDEDDLEDFREYILSEESLIESTDGFKILSSSPENSKLYYAFFGLVIPLAIFLVIFLGVRRAQLPVDKESKLDDNPLFANNIIKLRIIIRSMFSFLVVVNALAGIVIWAIAKNHPEWEQEEAVDKLQDTYRGSPNLVLESVPHELMTDSQYRVYAGFVVWITVLIAGFGLEIFVWNYFLQFWCSGREGLWRFSQFIFPFLLVTSLGLALHREFIALPIVVVGLWKMGFPETLMYLYLGLFSTSNSKLRRASDFLNGMGTVIHHGAASFIISMLVVGTIPESRYVLNGSLILVMQHWISLVAYVSVPLHAAIMLVLEYYFEWIVLSDFGHLYSLHWSTALGAGVILFAHWIYLLAAGLDLWEGESGEQEDNVHQRGLKVMTNTKPSSRLNSISQATSFLSGGRVSNRRRSSNIHDDQNEIVSKTNSNLCPRFQHQPTSIKLVNNFVQDNYKNSLKDLQPKKEKVSVSSGSGLNMVQKDAEIHADVKEFELPP